VASFSSLRREFLLKFNNKPVARQDIVLSLSGATVSSSAVNVIGEIHVMDPRNANHLLQFGEIRLGFAPVSAPGVSGSHWASSNGLELLSSSSDLRSSNPTVTAVISGSTAETSGIKNGTVLRVIGLSGTSVACGPTANTAIQNPLFSCTALLSESIDNSSVSIQYIGPTVWGTTKVRITISNIYMRPEGFLPRRFVAEVWSPIGGIDVTWSSEKTLIWCSPLPGAIIPILGLNGRVFVDGPHVPASVNITIPWPLYAGARLSITHPANLVLNQTEIIIPDLSIANVLIPVTVRALYLNESISGTWNVTIWSSGQSVVAPFQGPTVTVLDTVGGVRVARLHRNKISLEIRMGNRKWNSRLRKSVAVVKQNPWTGRRSCSATFSSTGKLACEITSSSELIVRAVNFFFEQGSMYTIDISVNDESFFKSGLFDIIVKDQANLPMEGVESTEIGFESMTDDPCVDAKVESRNGAWIPGKFGLGKVTLNRVRPDARNISILFPGSVNDSKTIRSDLGSFNFSLDISADSWIRDTSAITLVCLSDQGTVLGNSRLALPFYAELSVLYQTKSAIGFSSDFLFENVTLCNGIPDCVNLLTRVASQPGPFIFNYSNLNATANLTLKVDSFEVAIQNQNYPVLKSLAKFAVELLDMQRPDAFNRAAVTFIATTSCAKCNISLTAPPGFVFMQDCADIRASFRIFSCIGNLDKLWIESSETIDTYTEANFTIPVYFSEPENSIFPGVWKIVVGNAHMDERTRPIIGMATFNNVSLKAELNSFLLGKEINTVTLTFTPVHATIDSIVISLPPGFVLKHARPSFPTNTVQLNSTAVNFTFDPTSDSVWTNQSVTLSVLNPTAETHIPGTRWGLASYLTRTLVDYASIPSLELVEPMESISAARAIDGDSILVEFCTSKRVEFGDDLNFVIPYTIACNQIFISSSQRFIAHNCSSDRMRFTLRLGDPGTVVRAHSVVRVSLMHVRFPSSTPERNLITVTHDRSGRLVSQASTEGPFIPGIISDLFVSLENAETHLAGDRVNLSVSLISSATGSVIEITVIEPIGFDSRESTVMDASRVEYLSRDRLRIHRTVLANRITNLTLVNVILPPSPGFGIFNVSVLSDDSVTVATTLNTDSLYVPEKIEIDSITFEATGSAGNLPPRFGDNLVEFTLQISKLVSDSKFHFELEGFLNATIKPCLNGLLCGTIVPPRVATLNADAYLHSVTNDSREIVMTTIGVQPIALHGKLASRFELSIVKSDQRYPPTAEAEVEFNVSCTACNFDSLRIIPPSGFRILSIQTNDHIRVSVLTPRTTPSNNVWTFIGSIPQNESEVVTVWGTVEGFILTYLEAASIVYPALPSEQVPAPVLLAATFRMQYPSLVVKRVQMKFTPNKFHISDPPSVTASYLPVANWTVDPSRSGLSLLLNDSLTARDYAFGFLMTGPPFNGNYSISLELLDERNRVVDAFFFDETPTVQFGIPIVPRDSAAVFSRDDQSSAFQQEWNLTTQESSAFQIAQLTSYREVFRFSVLRPINMKSIARIDVRFPSSVRHNPIWARIDPDYLGVISSRSFHDNILSIELNQTVISLVLNAAWVDDIGSEFDISVPVMLPLAGPLPAFNFFTLTFRDSVNATLLTYVFAGHTLFDIPSFEPSGLMMILSGNVTSDSASIFGSTVLILLTVTLIHFIS
jgi:hypothetical protein